MTDQDKEQFGKIMGGLAENFGAQLSRAGVSMRFEALRDRSIEEIQRAAVSIMHSRKYTTMPTVADFLDYIGGGRVEDRAEIEAAKVWKAIESVGSYSSVTFDDPVTMAVVEYGFGGWTKLCGEMMVDQQKWFIKDFARLYGSYARQNVRLTGSLPGRGSGIKLIGDREKALEILNAPAERRGLEITALPGALTPMIEHLCAGDECS